MSLVQYLFVFVYRQSIGLVSKFIELLQPGGQIGHTTYEDSKTLLYARDMTKTTKLTMRLVTIYTYSQSMPEE